MRAIAIIVLWAASLMVNGQIITVGSKHFNESYILGEMIALILEEGGYDVDRKFNLGGTVVTFEALRMGAIDVYPEYTGTISTEILKESNLSLEAINRRLADQYKMHISSPYGFNNTYAILVKEELANQYSLSSITDLVDYPKLKVGLSHEFIDREDGWKNLATFYGLLQQPVGLEHGLAYQAIMENKIDATDAYSTDGEIIRYPVVALEDDRHFFPEYQAVSFYSDNLPEKAVRLLDQLAGLISEEDMQQLNAWALIGDKNHHEIAQTFLIENQIIDGSGVTSTSDIQAILEKTWVHIQLTFMALLASILVAIPLGILIYRRKVASRTILYLTGILQTIPSIALLALMIPIAGIGVFPAVIALFIYALLPILRNTVIGLTTVDPVLRKVASAMGLTPWNKLRIVEMPLAMPTILTGIRTAAVINVGTATLAAFIGAGGLGEFIVTGLALNNTRMILMGAIPAAILAIITELIFEAVEVVTIPNHLRQKIK